MARGCGCSASPAAAAGASARAVDHLSSSSSSISSPSTSTSNSLRTLSGTRRLTVVSPSCRSTLPSSSSALANADSLPAACCRVSDSFSSTFMSDMGASRSCVATGLPGFWSAAPRWSSSRWDDPGRKRVDPAHGPGLGGSLAPGRADFFFLSYGDHQDLHSFPTRRSSDLLPADRRLQGQRDRPHPALRDRGVPFLLPRSEEHTSELQSRVDLVCRLLLEKKKKRIVLPFSQNNNNITSSEYSYN